MRIKMFVVVVFVLLIMSSCVSYNTHVYKKPKNDNFFSQKGKSCDNSAY